MHDLQKECPHGAREGRRKTSQQIGQWRCSEGLARKLLSKIGDWFSLFAAATAAADEEERGCARLPLRGRWLACMVKGVRSAKAGEWGYETEENTVCGHLPPYPPPYLPHIRLSYPDMCALSPLNPVLQYNIS
eukprot:2396676-Rhodomonas_salina.1